MSKTMAAIHMRTIEPLALINWLTTHAANSSDYHLEAAHAAFDFRADSTIEMFSNENCMFYKENDVVKFCDNTTYDIHKYHEDKIDRELSLSCCMEFCKELEKEHPENTFYMHRMVKSV